MKNFLKWKSNACRVHQWSIPIASHVEVRKLLRFWQQQHWHNQICAQEIKYGINFWSNFHQFEERKWRWICWWNLCPAYGKCPTHWLTSEKLTRTNFNRWKNIRMATPSLQTASQGLTGTNPMVGGAWSTLSVRTNIRDNFPRAKETKRITVHGWEKRMSTKNGRKIIMRRILKGKHVLAHWNGTEAQARCKLKILVVVEDISRSNKGQLKTKWMLLCLHFVCRLFIWVLIFTRWGCF